MSSFEMSLKEIKRIFVYVYVCSVCGREVQISDKSWEGIPHCDCRIENIHKEG